MREKILKNLANWHAYHPWRMALVVLILTVIFFAFATRVSVTMRTSDLLPERDPKVVQFNKIIDEFTTATSLIVVVQGEEKHIKKFADQLAPQILETRDTSKNDSLQKQIDKLQKKIEILKARGKESKIAELQSEIKTLQSQMNYKLFQRVDYKVGLFLSSPLSALIRLIRLQYLQPLLEKKRILSHQLCRVLQHELEI